MTQECFITLGKNRISAVIGAFVHVSVKSTGMELYGRLYEIDHENNKISVLPAHRDNPHHLRGLDSIWFDLKVVEVTVVYSSSYLTPDVEYVLFQSHLLGEGRTSYQTGVWIYSAASLKSMLGPILTRLKDFNPPESFKEAYYNMPNFGTLRGGFCPSLMEMQKFFEEFDGLFQEVTDWLKETAYGIHVKYGYLDAYREHAHQIDILGPFGLMDLGKSLDSALFCLEYLLDMVGATYKFEFILLVRKYNGFLEDTSSWLLFDKKEGTDLVDQIRDLIKRGEALFTSRASLRSRQNWITEANEFMEDLIEKRKKEFRNWAEEIRQKYA